MANIITTPKAKRDEHEFRQYRKTKKAYSLPNPVPELDVPHTKKRSTRERHEFWAKAKGENDRKAIFNEREGKWITRPRAEREKIDVR